MTWMKILIKPDQPNRGFGEKIGQGEEDYGRDEGDEGKKVDWDEQGGNQAIPERGTLMESNLPSQTLDWFLCQAFQMRQHFQQHPFKSACASQVNQSHTVWLGHLDHTINLQEYAIPAYHTKTPLLGPNIFLKRLAVSYCIYQFHETHKQPPFTLRVLRLPRDPFSRIREIYKRIQS